MLKHLVGDRVNRQPVGVSIRRGGLTGLTLESLESYVEEHTPALKALDVRVGVERVVPIQRR
jgi:hypothetical protein